MPRGGHQSQTYDSVEKQRLKPPFFEEKALKNSINIKTVRPPPPLPAQNFAHIGAGKVAKKPPPPLPTYVTNKIREGWGDGAGFVERPARSRTSPQQNHFNKNKDTAGGRARILPDLPLQRQPDRRGGHTDRTNRTQAQEPACLQGTKKRTMSGGEGEKTWHPAAPKNAKQVGPKSASHPPKIIVKRQISPASQGCETARLPTVAKAPPCKNKYPLRPFSAKISISLSGVPRPKFDRATYEKSMGLAFTHPKLLRRRIKADINFLRQHPQRSNRVVNYGLYQANSLTISERKHLFGASSLTELIAMCEACEPDPHVFGSREGEGGMSLESLGASGISERKVDINEPIGSDLAATKAVIRSGPHGEYVERIGIFQGNPKEKTVRGRERGGRPKTARKQAYQWLQSGATARCETMIFHTRGILTCIRKVKKRTLPGRGRLSVLQFQTIRRRSGQAMTLS